MRFNSAFLIVVSLVFSSMRINCAVLYFSVLCLLLRPLPRALQQRILCNVYSRRPALCAFSALFVFLFNLDSARLARFRIYHCRVLDLRFAKMYR